MDRGKFFFSLQLFLVYCSYCFLVIVIIFFLLESIFIVLQLFFSIAVMVIFFFMVVIFDYISISVIFITDIIFYCNYFLL